jgi:hypothetical protein
VSTFADAPPPLRATGICNRCQRHTNDGIVHIVEQATGGGGRALFCADRKVCDKRLKPCK